MRRVYSAWRCGPLLAAWGTGRLVVKEERDVCDLYANCSGGVHKLHRESSFARVREVPDVVEKPLAAMRAGTSGAAEPWWPTAQDGKTPLPEAAPCAGPTAHGAADVVMEGEVFQTQLPAYWDLPRSQAAGGAESSRQTSTCVYPCTCHCVDRSRL